MDTDTMVLLTGLLGTIFVTVLIGGALVGAWMLGRRRGERDAAEGRLEGGGDRLARLEQMVERLAGEVDRLSESQHLTMRLLRQQSRDSDQD
jgi:hypothetical protein